MGEKIYFGKQKRGFSKREKRERVRAGEPFPGCKSNAGLREKSEWGMWGANRYYLR